MFEDQATVTDRGRQVDVPAAAAPQTPVLAPRRTKGLAVIGLKALLVLLVLYYVGRAMSGQFAEVRWDQVHIQPFLLTLAIALGCFTYLLGAVSYRALLRGFVQPPSLAAMCTVCWIPGLGKYLPGKVASAAGAIYMLNRYGVPTRIAASGVMLQQTLAILTGLMVALPLCFWQPIRQRFPMAWAFCLAAAVVGTGLLHPRILGTITGHALRLLRQEPLPHVPRLRQYAIPMLIQILSWMISGTVTWLTARGIVWLPLNQLPIFTAAMALAASLGTLSVIPGGLGVREGILLVVLTPLLGPLTTIVVVILRLQSIVVELLLAGVALLLLRRLKRLEADDGSSQATGG